MDHLLHKQYRDVQLTNQQVAMFADLVMADEPIFKTFLKIGEQTQDASKAEEDNIGITISEITKLVKINRRVQRRDGSFEEKYTNIDYKHAERVVAHLLMMSLCYYRAAGKTKLINYTYRGKQVAAEVIKRLRKKEAEGMMENVVHEQ